MKLANRNLPNVWDEELPALVKAGWLRPLRKRREASAAGADGAVRSTTDNR